MANIRKYNDRIRSYANENKGMLSTVVIAGTIGFTGYLIYKAFQPSGPGTNTGANQDAEAYRNNPANFTRQKAFYANLANSIYDYMNSMIITDGGTEDNVINPLSQLNQDEVIEVYKDFGARTFDFTVKPFDRSAHNLRAFGQNSLDDKGYNELNSILTNAGI